MSRFLAVMCFYGVQLVGQVLYCHMYNNDSEAVLDNEILTSQAPTNNDQIHKCVYLI